MPGGPTRGNSCCSHLDEAKLDGGFSRHPVGCPGVAGSSSFSGELPRNLPGSPKTCSLLCEGVFSRFGVQADSALAAMPSVLAPVPEAAPAQLLLHAWLCSFQFSLTFLSIFPEISKFALFLGLVFHLVSWIYELVLVAKPGNTLLIIFI